MINATRRPLVVVAILAVAALAAGCGSAAATATPSSSAIPTPPPTAAPSVSPSTLPSSTPAPTATPVVTPVPSAACEVTPQTGQLPSDRFTGIELDPTATTDKLIFVFGDPSLPGPAAPPTGSLEAAEPPYTEAGSGETIKMKGEHVLQIRFSGMSLSNDAGEETYAGPRGIEEPFPALRHAVVYDMSEGNVGWYVGFDGPGCVTLTREGNTIVLSMAHD